jgi:hypothetical protein
MGNGGGVFRAGNVVTRPRGVHAESTLALLSELATGGFLAPVPIGEEQDGNQRFRWIDGDVGVPPFPAWVMTDRALTSTGKLLRDYHETVAGFNLMADLEWSDELADPAGGPIICHNDVCPENVVFRDGVAVALLDFDFAAPGRPIWDLAQMARMWAPLRPPELTVGGMAALDPFHRLGVLTSAYGLSADDHEEFIEVTIESRRRADRFIRGRLAAGEPAFVQAWGPLGGEKALDVILEWFYEHRHAMLEALA